MRYSGELLNIVPESPSIIQHCGHECSVNLPLWLQVMLSIGRLSGRGIFPRQRDFWDIRTITLALFASYATTSTRLGIHERTLGGSPGLLLATISPSSSPLYAAPSHLHTP